MERSYICLKCGKVAQWINGSTEDYYCEDCVPRGCSCAQFLKKKAEIKCDDKGCIINPPEDYEDGKDEQGRLFPCCDYIWVGKNHES